VGDIKRTRRLHARLAYVMRVDNRASIALAAASARSVRRGLVSPRGVDAVGLRIARLASLGLRYVLFARHAGSRDVHKLTICSEC
jgi:hypothetical protein